MAETAGELPVSDGAGLKPIARGEEPVFRVHVVLGRLYLDGEVPCRALSYLISQGTHTGSRPRLASPPVGPTPIRIPRTTLAMNSTLLSLSSPTGFLGCQLKRRPKVYFY